MKQQFIVLGCLFFITQSGISQDYDDYLGVGHDNGITVTSSSASVGSDDENTINGFGMAQQFEDASRFLGQATLGVNQETIDFVSELGIENWIDQQYATPEMSYLDTTWTIWDHFIAQYIDQWGEGAIVGNDNILPFSPYWRAAWWHNTMTGEDLLRQKVALALSEILVVSEKSNLETSAFGMADYYDVLYNNAFGNYRELMEEVTLHPAMGYYLSHMNNEKTNEEFNIHPDENYAREVMQLFSIGLYELNNDGSIIVDENEVPVPTYDNNDIKEFAKIFTGLAPYQYWWPWEDLTDMPVFWDNPANTVPTINAWEPMQMFEEWHEPGEKYLLNGQVVPAGQSGLQDISDAMDNLFNHPNVGPFIGYRLIQRLVKSNPSPEYIDRVASAFNNNGEGVRGDMKAVIKTILLDEEARNCDWIPLNGSGKMREPMIRYIQLLKAFDAYNESGKYWSVGFIPIENMNQHTLMSPSVFNFFLPAYAPPGEITDAEMVAPEFQIVNSATSTNYINAIYGMLLADIYMDVTTETSTVEVGTPDFDNAFDYPENYVHIDISSEQALIDDVPAMVDRLDILLTGGTLSQESKSTIISTVDQFTFAPDIATKIAIMMVMISPDYVIQK